MTALIIDDEIQIRRLLRMALEARGHKVHEAANGQDGLSEIVFHKPDVVLLDMGLPDMDGLQVLKRLREWSAVPVLVLSVRNQEALKVSALEQGADDYVTKPFSTAELVARLSAIQRRSQAGPESTVLECGPMLLDLNSHRVTLHQRELKLTPTEYTLLKVMLRHAGRIITHAQLLREVWGPHGETQANSLRVYINLLRKKVESEAPHSPRIVNEPAIGYRLVIPDKDPQDG